MGLRYVLYDYINDELATTTVYDDQDAAEEDAEDFDDVRVLPLRGAEPADPDDDEEEEDDDGPDVYS